MIYYSKSHSPRTAFPLVPSPAFCSPPYDVFSSLTQSCHCTDCTPRGSSVHGDSPSKNTGVSYPSPGNLPSPGIEPRSPALQENSLPSEPPRKPRNTGVGSLSCLPRIFPAQESNWHLMHSGVDSLPAELPGKPSNAIRMDVHLCLQQVCILEEEDLSYETLSFCWLLAHLPACITGRERLIFLYPGR